MKRRWLALALLLAVAALTVPVIGRRRAASSGPPETDVAVTRGPFAVWSSYEGSIEARHVEPVFSRYRGGATLVELAPEGLAVKKGDPLARFDSSPIDSERVRLESGVTRAQAALDALANAELPLEQREIEAQLGDASFQWETEKNFLADNRALLDRDLVSRREVDQQALKVKSLDDKVRQIETRRKLVMDYLQPARLAQARAELDSQRQQVALLRQQIAHCEIVAPAPGVVVYQPLHVGGEFRTVRVGDSVFQNQPFMTIPDMSDLVVQCYVPESDLARVSPGAEAAIKPLAWPDRALRGAVESVGAMAQSRSGYPAWQKCFAVRVRLDVQDAQLRAGMTATVEILSYHRSDAVLVPRRIVFWDDGGPVCLVRTPTGVARRPLRLGHGNESVFEVREGLSPGERVLLP